MIRVKITKDDSPTLYSEAFGQTYHSIHGALSESLHVFIKHGLAEIAQSKKRFQSLKWVLEQVSMQHSPGNMPFKISCK